MKRLLIVLACVVLAFGIGSASLAKFAANNDRTGNYDSAKQDKYVEASKLIEESQANADANNENNAKDDGDSTDNANAKDNDNAKADGDSNSNANSKSYADDSTSVTIFNFTISVDDMNAILMDKKASELSSRTNYLALVNCTTHRVGIYQGSQGNWTRVQYYKCGDGKPSTPTIHGDFETGPQSAASHTYKLKYFDSEGSRCWYATRINGPYLFHSVLYKVDSAPNEINDGRTGEAVSHGCIRLDLENAKWIYDTIPELTRVIIYVEDEE